MESKRQQKFASLLQQELATVFQRDVPHLFTGLAPGISAIRVSPDLGSARVYLSALLAGSGEQMLEQVRDNEKVIRLALAKRVRQQVRVVPALQFFLDDSAAYAARMDEVFGGLSIPPPPADDKAEQPDAPKRPRLYSDEDEK
ncbi:ribosome-binding factor A [Hymenobacter lutimineralis]|uniref:Ribosome-binding factor A n=1 Tax=Hymenobacter lutimineralis TaxID=2606448 RepID=A0A5D6V867_9BACT|nr:MULTISPECIES: ribosome-binding factor A [Hymenobacter]QIX61607.1 ribosome-binding factor A [Hymenobacter sp. BT18]TYZ11382.1 ribosome-binding factor A [Hymenobacter lutimineralis]